MAYSYNFIFFLVSSNHVVRIRGVAYLYSWFYECHSDGDMDVRIRWHGMDGVGSSGRK